MIAPRSELPTKGFNREQGHPSPGSIVNERGGAELMMHGFEFGHLWRTLEKWIAPWSELPTKGFNREQGPPSEPDQFLNFSKITRKKVITTQWRPLHHQGARASRGPTRLRRGDSSGRRHQPGPRKERKDQLGPGPHP